MNHSEPLPARLLEAAWQATKLDDWGGIDLPHRLNVLCGSLQEEAQLNDAGRRFSYERILTAIIARLQVVACRTQYPDIASQAIERPIIIPSLPRTGTTVLFNLLAQDPGMRTAKTWEIMLPAPPPDAATYCRDPRIAAAETALKRWQLTRPTVMAIHPYGAELAEECVFMTEQQLTNYSPYFAYWNIPTFVAESAKWPMVQVFAEHYKFLQHLQSRKPAKRWLLKSPGHLGQLDPLTSVFSDAVFIQTHRDPMMVLPSYASLYRALREISTDDPALCVPGELMRTVSERIRNRIAVAAKFRARGTHKFVDVSYAELVARPTDAVRRIYDELEIELSFEAQSRMTQWMAANPKGKHGANPYSSENYQMDPGEIDHAFGDYMDTYQVAREGR